MSYAVDSAGLAEDEHCHAQILPADNPCAPPDMAYGVR